MRCYFSLIHHTFLSELRCPAFIGGFCSQFCQSINLHHQMRVGNLFSHLQFSNYYQSQHIPQDLVIYLCQQECCVINFFFFLAKYLNIPHLHPLALHIYKLNLCFFFPFGPVSPLCLQESAITQIFWKRNQTIIEASVCQLRRKKERSSFSVIYIIQDKRHMSHFFSALWKYQENDKCRQQPHLATC